MLPDDPGVVSHQLALAGQPTPDRTREAIGALSVLPGIVVANFDGGRLRLTYDVRRTSLDVVEQALAKLGVNLAPSWWQRLRRSWLRFTEENLRASLLRQPSPCCSKPPK